MSELKILNASKDKHLIGKQIGLRSPVCCAGGKRVCRTCYGNALSEINKDVNTGLVAVLRITEPLTQKLLSAKHLLTTNSEEINWGQDFLSYFSINMDSIYFADDLDISISFQKPTEYSEDQEMYAIDSFLIQDNVKKPIEYKSPVKLFINPEFLPTEKMKDDNEDITINSTSLRGDEFIFKFEPKNNAITKSLQQILDLVESNEHLGITDYNEFVNKFEDLLIENDMDYIKSVHAEMVTAVLIRDSETSEMLDFRKEQLDDYKILRVSKVNMLSPLAVSLSFERIPEQLVDLHTYEKTESSLMDYLFR